MANRHTIDIEDETVVAVHHPAESDRWLLCCHGFRSDKSGSYETRCERAVEEGYHGVRFDFRGCGESSRSFGEQTLSTRIADLAAVIEYFEPPEYVLFGSSFGGKVAIHSSPDDRCQAIAMRAPVTYNRAFEKYRGGFDPTADLGDGSGVSTEMVRGFFEDLDQYQFESTAATIDRPVVIFHGTADSSVPVGDSIDAIEAFGGDVCFQSFAGEGHLFSRTAEDRLRDQLFGWLAIQDSG